MSYLDGQDVIGKFPLGRVRVDYPEERRLHNLERQAPEYNKRIDALTAGAWLPENWQDNALVSSGSFCAPAMPDYTQLVVAGAHRPVASYLPSVQADRGQIIVQAPVKLSDIVSSAAQGAGSAVSVWTSTIDAAPGGTTKPRQTISCPATTTVTTEAIVERVKVGNFQYMADPEQVRAFLEVVAAAWARRAESELLRQIDANSLAVTTTQVLGATADFIGYIKRAAAAIRNRQRMPHDAQLRLLVPAWLFDFLGADAAHMHAGDGLDRFGVGEAEVRGWLAKANVGVTAYEDSANMVLANAANQLFPPQASGDLENWPPTPGVTNSRVIAYIFPEGAFARADAGTLDLGVVRDSALNDTNDFEIFSEGFEAVVPKVIESQKLTMTLCESGTGSSDTAASGYCTAS